MPHSLQLETERLILRPWRDSDRAPFLAMNADPAVMTYFASTLTPEESDASIARFQAAYDRDGFGFLDRRTPLHRRLRRNHRRPDHARCRPQPPAARR